MNTEQTLATIAFQHALEKQAQPTQRVEDFINSHGYRKIDPSVMFISVAKEDTTGLWHAILLAPSNETETGFRRLSMFQEGTMLPESAKEQAGKMCPTVAILVNGLYEWPYFDHAKAKVWERKNKIIQEAEARRERRRAKRIKNANSKKPRTAIGDGPQSRERSESVSQSFRGGVSSAGSEQVSVPTTREVGFRGTVTLRGNDPEDSKS